MKISVVIIVKNEAKFIGSLLQGLTEQTHQEFEAIVVDNGSTDGTKDIIDSFSGLRLKYFFEPSSCGLAALRNIGIEKSTGKYIFFTDGDCLPEKHWLQAGMEILKKGDYAGVNGKTYYESKEKITISDYNTHQFFEGQFMTCNIAYRRDALEKAGCFDPIFKYGHEDRDLAYRILRFGKICFSPDMLVAHQNKKLTVRALFNRARRAENAVELIKKHGSFPELKKNILYPGRLLIIFCPFILILAVSYRTFYDLVLGVFKYFSYIYERALIWKAAVRSKIFIV